MSKTKFFFQVIGSHSNVLMSLYEYEDYFFVLTHYIYLQDLTDFSICCRN